ncbi:MAG: response regulator, partial [Anaerolineae bacterium]|nr:response regulator [Anaerolineae bacterium]
VAAPRPRFVVLEEEPALAHMLDRYMDSAEIVPTRTWEGALRELSKTPAQALLVNQVVSLGAWSPERSASLPFGTPAIICSIPGLHEMIRAYGVSDYLVKPISRESLLATLAQVNGAVETVLIVDDEPEALRLFQRMLHSAERPYRVLTATNGEEALQWIKRERPDVILLDLVMPEMDGYRLLNLRNADPDLRHIPVIIISARDPAGQPIVSNAFSLVCGGGLSMAQLLAFVEAVTSIAGPERRSAHPVPPEKLLD